ncbi:hypothetical protein GKZ28_01250 [Clostridium chromiireducens]|uniref:Uncharacterized protein n=1 Tax=Clostridium chromiireducens TaxID=225345 RepID=A0A964RIN2_9CLOT|nr:hypothetical protein [Clostridium chromiireducens]MVX62326.1 hypothetical protein [Clostridium chromiireducens]
MDEREELKQELQWMKYRMNMLDIMEKKLLQMKELAEQVKNNNLTEKEYEVLNLRLNDLAAQVRALDEESRKAGNEKILE